MKNPGSDGMIMLPHESYSDHKHQTDLVTSRQHLASPKLTQQNYIQYKVGGKKSPHSHPGNDSDLNTLWLKDHSTVSLEKRMRGAYHKTESN